MFGVGRHRCRRHNHGVVGEPVGLSCPGLRRRRARYADVQGALHHPHGRRRVRRQNGDDRTADRRRTRPQSAKTGARHTDPRARFRDDPRSPPGQGMDEDRCQIGRHIGRAGHADRPRRWRLCRRQSRGRRDLRAIRPRAVSRRKCPARFTGNLYKQTAFGRIPGLWGTSSRDGGRDTNRRNRRGHWDRPNRCPTQEFGSRQRGMDVRPNPIKGRTYRVPEPGA